MDQSMNSEDNFFNSEESLPSARASISWESSEFIHHEKTMMWYVSASLIIALLGGLIYVVIRDIISPVAVVVLGALLMLGGSKKPKTRTYHVDDHGIVVGDKSYLYDEFQSFSIQMEGAIESIMLLPQKRWAMPLTLYFEPKDGQKIFDVLSSYIPFEERDKDPIDKFLQKIRF